jgi:uncharacterized protein YdeI (YjbR/CyaY-like superfamily)
MEKVPSDLRRALAAKPKAKKLWENLTPIARRDFISWVEGAKQEETRKRRIERTCDMLLTGKRRPCCYAVVPMSLYKALDANPKAKATWKTLTPDERRDFVSWIDAAKEPERTERIEKVGAKLAAGRRKP